MADQHIPASAPADFNQAIMEFGAIQCTPAKPDCLFCPMQTSCWAFQHGQVALLPVKSKAKKARTRYFHYFVLRHGDLVYLRERGEKDIWQGLYDFALAETDAPELRADELARHLDALGAAIDTSQVAEPSIAYRHVLSHQKLEVRFHDLPLTETLPDTTLRDLGLRAYSATEIEALPKPKLIANYIEQNL